jgi:hypothetical protein
MASKLLKLVAAFWAVIGILSGIAFLYFDQGHKSDVQLCVLSLQSREFLQPGQDHLAEYCTKADAEAAAAELRIGAAVIFPLLIFGFGVIVEAAERRNRKAVA